MTPTNETLQSAVSYGTAAGGIAVHSYMDFFTFSEIVEFAQHATVFVALAVGVLRLIYDGVRLVRFLKDKQK